MESWFFYSLIATFCWAVSNVIDSAMRREYIRNDYVMTWIIGLSRLPLLVALLIFVPIHTVSTASAAWIIISGVLFVVPFIFYYKVLEYEEPTRIILFLQLLPLFVLILGYFMIGEVLTRKEIFAFTVLLVGGALAGLKKLAGVWSFSKAVWFMVAAMFIWALSDVILKKYTPNMSSFFAAFALYVVGSVLMAIIALFFRSWRKTLGMHLKNMPARGWWLLIIDQTVGIAGTVAFSYALIIGKASLATVLTGIQPLFVFILGLIFAPYVREFYKETVDKTSIILKLISFICIIAGLMILAYKM